jgi:DNA-binding MarR family transcriptional regulator
MSDCSQPSDDRAAVKLLDLIPRLMRLIGGEWQASAAGSLTVSQLRLLMRLEHGSRLPSEIARELRISPATASEAVELLVRRGLVARGASGDRRQTPLALTPEGAALALAARERALDRLRRLLVELDADETATLASALGLLEDRLVAETTTCEAERAR